MRHKARDFKAMPNYMALRQTPDCSICLGYCLCDNILELRKLFQNLPWKISAMSSAENLHERLSGPNLGGLIPDITFSHYFSTAVFTVTEAYKLSTQILDLAV